MLLFCIFYVWMAVEDFRCGEISVRHLRIFGLAGGIQLAMTLLPGWHQQQAGILAFIWGIQSREHWELLASTLPGLVFLGLGRVTGGALGSGDGWFLLFAGCYLNLGQICILGGSGILVSGIVGLLVLVVGYLRGEDWRRRRIPLLPCMLPAVLFMTMQVGA